MEDLGGAQRILENQFMHSFSTGNFIIDTLIKGLIITATTGAFFYLKTVVSNWHQYVDRMLALIGLKTNKIIINWKVNKAADSEVRASKRFEAVLHQVMKLQFEEAGICTFLENPNPESLSFMVSQNSPFTFCPGVFGTIRTDQTENQGHHVNGQILLVPKIFVAEIYSRTTSLKDLYAMINTWVEEYEQFQKETEPNEIKFFGRLTKHGQFNFSDRLFAILHQIEKKGTSNPDIKVLKEFSAEEIKVHYDRVDGYIGRRAEKLIPEDIEVDKNVFCKVIHNPWKEKEGNSEDKMQIEVKIYSKILKIPELVDFIKKWEEEYKEYNQFEKGLIYFIFNQPPKDRYERQFTTEYTQFSFESGKSFENVSFPEKQQLLEKIQFFQDNEAWYLKRGIPHMFGLLLHGEPGCGKTSIIKAIANMTQRHIISVPLKNVNTTADLYQALYGGKINKKSIPMAKRLYVLEDIDCGGLEQIVSKRKEKNEIIHNDKNTDNDILEIEDNGNQKNKKELTLSDLLEAFDGVLEMKGRMMIVTTNHVDKIDPALIRPGRMDTSLELKRCKRENIMEICENFFGKEMIPKDFDMSNVTNSVWTPAEVVQICVNQHNNVKEALQNICERKHIPKMKKEKEESVFYS